MPLSIALDLTVLDFDGVIPEETAPATIWRRSTRSTSTARSGLQSEGGDGSSGHSEAAQSDLSTASGAVILGG